MNKYLNKINILALVEYFIIGFGYPLIILNIYLSEKIAIYLNYEWYFKNVNIIETLIIIITILLSATFSFLVSRIKDNAISNLNFKDKKFKLSRKNIFIYLNKSSVEKILDNKKYITNDYGNKDWLYYIFEIKDVKFILELLKDKSFVDNLIDIDKKELLFKIDNVISEIIIFNKVEFYQLIEKIFVNLKDKKIEIIRERISL